MASTSGHPLTSEQVGACTYVRMQECACVGVGAYVWVSLLEGRCECVHEHIATYVQYMAVNSDVCEDIGRYSTYTAL